MLLLIGILVLLIILYAAASFAFHQFLSRPRTEDYLDPTVLRLSPHFGYEPVLTPAMKAWQAHPRTLIQAEAADGVRLQGLWLPAPKAPVCLIQFHGYGSLPQNEDAILAEWARKKGWSVLSVYERAHGESGGSWCSLGLLEADDCRVWAETADRMLEGHSALVLSGTGLGAAAVLGSTAYQLPDSVCAIIAESAYTGVRPYLKYTLRKRYAQRTFPLLPLMLLCGRFHWHRSAASQDTITALQNTYLPVFFAHGKADSRVPEEMTKEAYDACGSMKELYISEEAGYAACAMADGSRYTSALEKFLMKALAMQGKST